MEGEEGDGARAKKGKTGGREGPDVGSKGKSKNGVKKKKGGRQKASGRSLESPQGDPKKPADQENDGAVSERCSKKLETKREADGPGEDQGVANLTTDVPKEDDAAQNDAAPASPAKSPREAPDGLLKAVFNALGPTEDCLGQDELARMLRLLHGNEVIETWPDKYVELCAVADTSPEAGIDFDLFEALVGDEDGQFFPHGGLQALLTKLEKGEGVAPPASEEKPAQQQMNVSSSSPAPTPSSAGSAAGSAVITGSTGPSAVVLEVMAVPTPKPNMKFGSRCAVPPPMLLKRGEALQLGPRKLVNRICIGVRWTSVIPPTTGWGRKKAEPQAPENEDGLREERKKDHMDIGVLAFNGGVCVGNAAQVSCFTDTNPHNEGQVNPDRQRVYVSLAHANSISECIFVVACIKHPLKFSNVEQLSVRISNADTGQELGTFRYSPKGDDQAATTLVLARLNKHFGDLGHWQFMALGQHVRVPDRASLGTFAQTLGLGLLGPSDLEINGRRPPPPRMDTCGMVPKYFIRPLALHNCPKYLTPTKAAQIEAAAKFIEGRKAAATAAVAALAAAAMAEGGIVAAPLQAREPLGPPGGGLGSCALEDRPPQPPEDVDPCDFSRPGEIDFCFDPLRRYDERGYVTDVNGGWFGGGGACLCCDDC